MRLILQKWFWFVHIPFISTVKFQSLAQFPVDHPSLLCLVFHSFCASSQRSIIMWLIVSSQSPHYLHLLFYGVIKLLLLLLFLSFGLLLISLPDFRIVHTTPSELSLSYYLPIAGGRIIGLIPFPRVLVLCEMQSASSRIWTRVAVSISYDDNHYTTGTSNELPKPKAMSWIVPLLVF